MKRFFVFLATHWLLIVAPGAFAVPPLPHQSPHPSVGTVNCASSNCHGQAAARDPSVSPILQNEYTTWMRLDKHARAYSVLLNDQSRRIARNLGLKEPAHEARLCLDCHAHNPPAALKGERHTVSEGVGCEACHGPAEKWIKSHTLAGATHADNIARGLYPTSDPVAAAKLCLSCHFGDETRFVTHRMMGAGHPRMSFEIDTFSALAPAHYRIDADWQKRKGEHDSVKLWAIGQALAARQMLDTLTDPKRGRDGLFPELVLFDCHACHHPMSDQKWAPRTTATPGRIRLNDSALLMLRALVKALHPTHSKDFDAQVERLHQAVSGAHHASAEDVARAASSLSAMIEEEMRVFEHTRFTNAHLVTVFEALIQEARSGQYRDYAGAEQAYLAIASLANALAKRGLLPPAPANRALARLRTHLANENAFNAGQFAQALTPLRDLLPAKGQ
jgi:hypothetical protein